MSPFSRKKVYGDERYENYFLYSAYVAEMKDGYFAFLATGFAGQVFIKEQWSWISPEEERNPLLRYFGVRERRNKKPV